MVFPNKGIVLLLSLLTLSFNNGMASNSVLSSMEQAKETLLNDNLSGSWMLESGTPRRGVQQQLLNLIQVDQVVTGDFNGTPLDIEYNDGELSFSVTKTTALGQLTLNYSGIVEGRRMYGEFVIANGPNAGKKEKWTATKLNANVGGRWLVGFSTPWSGAQEQIMVLDQIGDYAIGDFNGDPIDATVNGDNISFRLSRQTPIGELSMDYEGLVEGTRIYGSFKILDGPSEGQIEKWSAAKLNIHIDGKWSMEMDEADGDVEFTIIQEQNSAEAVGTINELPVVIFVDGGAINFTMTSVTEDGIVSKKFTGFKEGDTLYGDYLIMNGPSAGSKYRWKAKPSM